MLLIDDLFFLVAREGFFKRVLLQARAAYQIKTSDPALKRGGHLLAFLFVPGPAWLNDS